MVRNNGPKKARRQESAASDSSYSSTGRAPKCQKCSNPTWDPSGLCHHHQMAAGIDDGDYRSKASALSSAPKRAESPRGVAGAESIDVTIPDDAFQTKVTWDGQMMPDEWEDRDPDEQVDLEEAIEKISQSLPEEHEDRDEYELIVPRDETNRQIHLSGHKIDCNGSIVYVGELDATDPGNGSDKHLTEDMAYCFTTSENEMLEWMSDRRRDIEEAW